MEIKKDEINYQVTPAINLFPASKTYCLIFNSIGRHYGEQVCEVRMNKAELDSLIDVLDQLRIIGSLYIKQETEGQND